MGTTTKYNYYSILITLLSVFYLAEISFGGCCGKNKVLDRVKEVFFVSYACS